MHPQSQLLYDNKLRNYTNAVGTETRGYGAALTYVGISKRGIIPRIDDGILDVFLSLTPEIFYDFKYNQKQTIGASISYYRLEAENGWDRFDSLEAKEFYLLAHVFPATLYLHHKDMKIGLSYSILKKSELGNIAGIKTYLSLFFAKSW